MSDIHNSFKDAKRFDTAARMVDYILSLFSRAWDVATQIRSGIDRFRGVKALESIQPLLDGDLKMRCMDVEERPNRLTIGFALDFTENPVTIGGQLKIVGLGVQITRWRPS